MTDEINKDEANRIDTAVLIAKLETVFLRLDEGRVWMKEHGKEEREFRARLEGFMAREATHREVDAASLNAMRSELHQLRGVVDQLNKRVAWLWGAIAVGGIGLGYLMLHHLGVAP